MKIVNRYIAHDGREFVDEELCQAHDDSLYDKFVEKHEDIKKLIDNLSDDDGGHYKFDGFNESSREMFEHLVYEALSRGGLL